MTRSERNSKENITAKYGLIGTIATAGISLIAAYMGYLGNRVQAERPIIATETAEARYSLGLTQTAEANLLVTPVITPTPTNSPVKTVKDELMVESEWYGCPFQHVLPDYIDPQNDLEKANEQVRTLLQNESSAETLTPPQGDAWTAPYYSFTLTASSENKDWVILDKTISISVHRQDAPEHVNMAVVGGCGGVMEIRDFPKSILRADSNDYVIQETFADDTIAGFTLMPGEPEMFQIPIVCQAPGIYNMNVKMKVKYQQQEEEINITIPPYTCPESYTEWGIWESMVKDATVQLFGSYSWTGTEYVQVP